MFCQGGSECFLFFGVFRSFQILFLYFQYQSSTNIRNVPSTMTSYSRYNSLHVITLSQELVHSYLLHLPNTVHARFILAQCAKLGRYPMERRTEVNIGIFQRFVFMMSPDVQRHLEEHQYRQEPAETQDSKEEQTNWIHLAERCSDWDRF